MIYVLFGLGAFILAVILSVLTVIWLIGWIARKIAPMETHLPPDRGDE
jgi:hypothetical protein